MEIQSQLLYPTLGFLLTLVFGFWLSRRGKPYNGLLFNIHKLIALATVILSTLAVYRALQGVDVMITLPLSIILSALSIIALFVSGGLMSAEKGEFRVMKLIHNLSPFVLVIATGYAVYLLR